MEALIRCYRDPDGTRHAVTAPGMHDLAHYLGDIDGSRRVTLKVLDAVERIERGEVDSLPPWPRNGYFVRMSREGVTVGEARGSDLRPKLDLSLASFKDAMLKWLEICDDQ